VSVTFGRAMRSRAMTTSPRLLLALTSVLIGASVAAPSSSSAAFAKKCPAKAHTVAVSPDGAYSRLWTVGGTLYGCIKYGGEQPRARRLGPWTPGGQVSFVSTTAVWTRAYVRDGVRSDRLWAADAYTGERFLAGKRLVPKSGSAPDGEARIQRVLAEHGAAAWVTQTGEVGFALDVPWNDDETPSRSGGGPDAELTVDDNRTLVGRFDTDPGQLADTLKITTDDGEGDECGGVTGYTLSVRPEPTAAPVKVNWGRAWDGPFPSYC